ncbi:MAG: hypothetical protein KC468_30910, partial [Myxococcales bacterium]|nr:hypothetical protein [Myxococcales bacterium]
MSAPRRPVSLSRVLALLVERERDALLDAPIASLEREELEPLLTLARERGVETLRGLHGVSELEAALGELVSPSEQRALLRALLELSDDGVGPEARWSPRALVDEVPPQFPNEPEERRAWLSRHELDDVLDTPVEALRFLLSSHHARHIKLLGDHVSIGAWIGLRPSTRARLEIPEFDHAIARYLRGMVVRRRIERARESTWNDPPRDARLRRLSERLRSSLGRLSHCQAYMAPLPRGHVLRVVMDPPEVLFGVPEDHPLVRIRLAGFADHGVLELRASDRQRGEVHARLVIEWCLDAIHDPAHPLHTPFVRLFAPAEGDPLLVGLERLALAQRLGAPQQEDTRLTWRVTTSADARCTVTPALQQRRGSGAWTRGRRVTIDGLDELLDGLAPEDVALARLLASADPSSTRAALAMLSRHPRVFGARGAARVTVHEQRLTIRLVDLGDGVRVTLALGGVEVEPAAAA